MQSLTIVQTIIYLVPTQQALAQKVHHDLGRPSKKISMSSGGSTLRQVGSPDPSAKLLW